MGATSEQFDLWVALRLKDQGLQAGLGAAQKHAAGAKTEVAALGKSIKSTTGSMLGMVGALAGVSGLVGIVSKGASEFTKLEDGLAKVDTLLAEGQNATVMYGDAMEAMSVRFGTDISVVTTGLYQAISASVDTGKAMDFMAVAGKTAIGGLTDTATAVDGLTNVINAYGLGTENATHVADVFALAQKRGKTTIGEMAAVIGQIAPLAASMGVSFESVAAALAAATKQGINIATATASLRQVIASIIKPPAEAADALKELGIQWGAGTLKSKGLAGSLKYLQEGLGGNMEMMSKVLGSVEGLNIALALTSDRGMKDFVEIQDEMITKSGEIEVAFGKMENTTGHKIRSMEQAFNRASRQIGVAFFDAIGLKSGDFEKTVVSAADEIGKAFGTVAKNIDLIITASERLFALWAVSAGAKVLQAGIGSLAAISAASAAGTAVAGGAAVAAGTAAAAGGAAVAGGIAATAAAVVSGAALIVGSVIVSQLVADVIDAKQINGMRGYATEKQTVSELQLMAEGKQGTAAEQAAARDLWAQRNELLMLETQRTATYATDDFGNRSTTGSPWLNLTDVANEAIDARKELDASIADRMGRLVGMYTKEMMTEAPSFDAVAPWEFAGGVGARIEQAIKSVGDIKVKLAIEHKLALEKGLKHHGSVRARIDRGEGQARLVSPEYRMTLVREGTAGLFVQPLQEDVIDLAMLDARG